MDFSFTEEQNSFKASVIKFAKNELNNGLIEKDEKGNFPSENWKKCSDMGLLSLLAPEKYGGQGSDLLTTALSLEALSYACKDSGLVHAIGTQLCVLAQFILFGTKNQKEKYSPKIANGESIGAQAMTEPGAGSDLLSMLMRAEKKEDNFLLNGTKTFISNGPVADIIVVFAITNPQRIKFGGLSCFIIENGLKGFSRGQPLEKMGLRTLQNGELYFEDCLLPSEMLLGKEGQGMVIFNEVIERERVLFGAAHIGTMERMIELTINYAKTRNQFGNKIIKFQSIANKIADMKMNLELGRMILYKSAWLKDQKKRAALETSIAKLFISENLKQLCMESVQIHGAYGYMKEFEVERDLRDSIASTIYSGTSEIQKNIISSLL